MGWFFTSAIWYSVMLPSSRASWAEGTVRVADKVETGVGGVAGAAVREGAGASKPQPDNKTASPEKSSLLVNP